VSNGLKKNKLIMHKSSSLTFIYKYLFTPIWGGMFAFGIITTWTQEDQFSYDWSRGAAIMVSWGLVWLIILMIRLRSIEASKENLVINKLNGQETIDYKDIEYVSQIAMVRPTLISLKYNDRKTGESHKILIMPSTSSQIFKFNFFEELEMTKFIREQMVKANSNYNTDSEPSKWIPAGLIMLTGIPVGLIVNLFFTNFDKY
jgi:hypothetical protein